MADTPAPAPAPAPAPKAPGVMAKVKSAVTTAVTKVKAYFSHVVAVVGGYVAAHIPTVLSFEASVIKEVKKLF